MTNSPAGEGDSPILLRGLRKIGTVPGCFGSRGEPFSPGDCAGGLTAGGAGSFSVRTVRLRTIFRVRFMQLRRPLQPNPATTRRARVPASETGRRSLAGASGLCGKRYTAVKRARGCARLPQPLPRLQPVVERCDRRRQPGAPGATRENPFGAGSSAARVDVRKAWRTNCSVCGFARRQTSTGGVQDHRAGC